MGYEVKRGAAACFPLEITDGTFTGATAKATLKQRPGDRSAVAAVFTVTRVDHVNDRGGGPGWLCTLSSEQTAALSPGTYVCDARIQLLDGSIFMAPTQRVSVTERVTGESDE